MKTIPTRIQGVCLIPLDTFEDNRGEFVETYNHDSYEGTDIRFIQDDISHSKRNVLRGIHCDSKTYKLITCIHGKIQFVVVDILNNRHQSFILEPYTQILVPPGIGCAHLVLSKEAIISYKQNTYYDVNIQFSYKWDDKSLKIKWLCNKPILSKRDS